MESSKDPILGEMKYPDRFIVVASLQLVRERQGYGGVGVRENSHYIIIAI